MKLADSFSLGLSILVDQVPTQYTDNSNDSNSVIDLMFLRVDFEEFNNYSIIPNLRSLLDHTLLTISIIINKEFIQDKWWMIVKSSNEEESFILECSGIHWYY